MSSTPSNGNGQSQRKRKYPASNNNPRAQKRNKILDARTVTAQTSDKAFSNGELNVDNFVKAREFEIKALEDGLKRSKQVLSRRAFQDVPKDLRRRTASHNVKRVPKRLRQRAAKEVRETLDYVKEVTDIYRCSKIIPLQLLLEDET
jgi:ribonuclease P/MRP protein subunit POP1